MSGRPSEAPPLTLARLAQEGASGELVCVSSDTEVHVYLQGGRIAWASSSGARFGLARELERRGVETALLEEALSHCRTSREPIGETLVAWGAVTADGLRDALRAQVEDALDTLLADEHARGLFLRRGVSTDSYDQRFTFALDEVLHAQPDDESVRQARIRSAAIRAAVPELIWLVDTKSSVRGAKWPDPRREAVCRSAFDRGADFVALRASDVLVLGVAHEDGDGGLWLGLPPGANLGSVLASIADHVARTSIPPPPRPREAASEQPFTPLRCRGCDALGQETLERFHEVRAVVITEPDTSAACAVVRDGTSASRALADTRAHEALLCAADDESCSLCLGLGDLTWFALAQPGDARRLWIGIDRGAARGLGWALLSTLGRQLLSTPCAAPASSGTGARATG